MQLLSHMATNKREKLTVTVTSSSAKMREAYTQANSAFEVIFN